MKRASIISITLVLLFAPALANNTGNVEKGKEVFESLTCIDCHKGGGNQVKPTKPLKGESFAKKYKDDKKIEQVIRKGVPQASMPGFGTDVISDVQMKDLIAYIRSLTPTSLNGKEKGSKKSGK